MLQTKLVDNAKMWSPFFKRSCVGRTSILFSEGTSRNLCKLIERCRLEKTTVAGVLCAAAYFSFEEMAHGMGRPPAARKLRLPVSIRGRIPEIPVDYLGNPMSQFCTYMSVDNETPFWDVARSIRRDIVKFVETGDAKLFQLIADRGTGMAAADFALSNMGPYPASDGNRNRSIDGIWTGGAGWPEKICFLTHSVDQCFTAWFSMTL